MQRRPFNLDDFFSNGNSLEPSEISTSVPISQDPNMFDRFESWRQQHHIFNLSILVNIWIPSKTPADEFHLPLHKDGLHNSLGVH